MKFLFANKSSVSPAVCVNEDKSSSAAQMQVRRQSHVCKDSPSVPFQKLHGMSGAPNKDTSPSRPLQRLRGNIYY
jgi:hypothetical protein